MSNINLTPFFRSVLEQDTAQIVICDLDHTIIYMNPEAVERYGKKGGKELVGRSLKSCHNEESGRIIDKVVAWFAQSENNNIMYTFYNEKLNKDVYMVALRDESGKLIGYYEKHEFRNREAGQPYNFA